LRPLGLTCRPGGMIPAKAAVEVPAACQKTALEPCLAEAQAGQGAVWLVEAAPCVVAPL